MQIHNKGNYMLPLKNMAYVLYNMSLKDYYDPTIYEKFEANYRLTSDKHMVTRIAFGAVYAYYRSNQGTQFGIDFWESKLEDHLDNLHVQEIW